MPNTPDAIEAVIASLPVTVYLRDLLSGATHYLQVRLGELITDSSSDGSQRDDPIVSALHPDDLPAVVARYDRIRAGGTDDITPFDYRLLIPERGYVWFRSIENAAARDAEGRITRILGLAIEVAAPRGSQVRPDTPQSEASTVGSDGKQALAKAIHDLRGPLNAIAGWVHILGERKNLPPDAMGMTATTRAAVRQSALAVVLSESAD